MGRPPLAYRAIKRGFDVLAGGLALVVLSPLLAAIAVALKLQDPRGPLFFVQERSGLGGRTFGLLKFRTMVTNAEELKERYRHLSVVPWPDFRVPDDPRVTRIGRVLRRTSLDELPQLLNVLRGDMTLVGPRPTSFHRSTYDLWQTERLHFRPGITGPWQVRGRQSMDFEERCRLEIDFFRRPSIAREVRLLVETLGVVARRTGTA